MNTPGKDYTHHSWLAAAALIAVLVAVSFIPPQSVGGVKLRRANILSDLLSFDDAEAAEPPPSRRSSTKRSSISTWPPSPNASRPTPPRASADHLRMAPRAGHGPPRTRRARLGALRRDADPDRGFQRQRTHPGPSATRCSTLRARCASPSWATRSSRATSSRPTCANGSSRPTRAAARDSPRWPRR